MNKWYDIALTIVVSVLTSSGLWSFLQKKSERKDTKTRLLVGIAHDRIVHLGMSYITRGYITRDEYENLHDYLYVPYEKLGGNGSAKRVMQEVDKLIIREARHERKEDNNET